MPLPVLALIGAGAGMALGINSAQNKLEEAERQKRLLDIQQAANRRRLGSTSSILEGNLSVAAMQASGESKKAAVSVFQEESTQAAEVGASGLSGGSGFYNLANKIAQDRADLSNLNQQIGTQIRTDQLSGAEQIAGIKDEIAYTQEQEDQINEKIGYLSSPFAFMMSAASGAMSGYAMGENLTAMGVKATGKEAWGQIGSYPKAPELQAANASIFASAAGVPLTPMGAGVRNFIDIPVVSAIPGKGAAPYSSPDLFNLGGLLSGPFNKPKTDNPLQFPLY